MTAPGPAAPAPDAGTGAGASTARMYNHYLGGKDNFAADRAAAAPVPAAAAAAAARDNRAFLARAVGYAARAGLTRFIDIGCGLPAPDGDNTHDIAARAAREAKTAYIDWDSHAAAHAAAILANGTTATAGEGDLRDPAAIFASPPVTAILEPGQPVAVILAAVLHFLDDADAQRATGWLRDNLPAGSALIVTHATADYASPAEAAAVTNAYQKAGTPIYLRPRQAIAAYLHGWTVIEPGVTAPALWRPDPEPPAAPGPPVGYAALAVKPAR